jgi:hypothetical protein
VAVGIVTYSKDGKRYIDVGSEGNSLIAGVEAAKFEGDALKTEDLKEAFVIRCGL